MQISQNLKLKQSQSLVMTPQLQQAIKLLQLNNLELTNLVNKELEENPFLENENIELDNEETHNDEETFDLGESFENGESLSDEPKNEDFDNRWDSETPYDFSNRNSGSDVSDSGTIIEQTLSNKVSLKSILTSQAELEFEGKDEKKVSEILIDYVDENGWMTERLEDLSEFTGFSIEFIADVLKKNAKF